MWELVEFGSGDPPSSDGAGLWRGKHAEVGMKKQSAASGLLFRLQPCAFNLAPFASNFAPLTFYNITASSQYPTSSIQHPATHLIQSTRSTQNGSIPSASSAISARYRP
jgi:hypothetical protein